MSLEINGIGLTVNRATIYEVEALRDVSFALHKGEITGLIGHSGSGKSSLLQIIAGLQPPTSGTVSLEGMPLYTEQTDRRRLRQQVGISFQYPEHQFFEDSVEKELCFGLHRQGLESADIKSRIAEVMSLFGLDESLLPRSPFDLSGGQMRRLGLAITFALHPTYLLLDEPLAGLDPKGRKEVMSAITSYARRAEAMILFVSHNMDDVARIADRLLVLREGQLILDGSTQDVFLEEETLRSAGLDLPEVFRLVADLRARGVPLADRFVVDVDDALQVLCDAYARRRDR